MAGDPAPVPIEIPWELLGTRLASGPPPSSDFTSISVFSYVPKLETLEHDYPNDRLVYLKFSVSVSSLSLISLANFGGPPVFDHLAAREYPVWRLLLDVAITVPGQNDVGIKPYFLAAAPIRRTMLETGVVGSQVFEGESNGLAVGKSGAQMHESFHTSTDTSTSTVAGGAAGFVGPFVVGVGGSKSSTGTNVSGGRDVTQVVDSTQRDASEERRELFSHLTNINNVLTLLRTTLVGSPFLRFDLSPRPLRPLTLDPSDPNLWYAELLNRRSSGIEGLQDFYAIAVVPRDAAVFCIKADVQRVFVIEPPLPKPDFNRPDDLSPASDMRLLNYLYSRYPRGTPLDKLDVDLGPEHVVDEQKGIMDGGLSPVVQDWFVLGNVRLYAGMAKTHQFGTVAVAAEMVYKRREEVWLEMLRDEYETELARSPLERGLVVSMSLSLFACRLIGKLNFPIPPASTLALSQDELWQVPSMVDFTPYLTGVAAAAPQHLPGRDRYRAAVMAWNTLSSQVQPDRKKELRFDDPRMVDLILATAVYLGPDDPANQSLDAIAALAGLPSEGLLSLKAAGVNDLHALATVVRFAPSAERRNRPREAKRTPPSAGGCNLLRRFLQRRSGPEARREPVAAPAPLPVTSAQASELRTALGAALQARFEEAQRQKP
jgi:hypothetical protein